MGGGALVGYARRVPETEIADSAAARRKAVGRRIRDLREQARIPQVVVAKAAGITRPFYVGVEAGRCNVSLDNLFAIADALGVDIAEFFTAAGH